MTEGARSRLRTRRRDPDPAEASKEPGSAARRGRVSARPASRVFSSQMHALRLGFVAVVAWSAYSDTISASPAHWGGTVLGYGVLILVADRARRVWSRLQASVALVSLLADGVFLGWILHLSGGTLSPLRFLIYIHLIAATLIYTYRVGIGVTVMHSLFFFLVWRSQAAGLIEAHASAGGFAGIGEEAMTPRDSWIFNTVILWLVALATAPFSSVNDRELRRRKDDLSDLAQMANDFENLRSPKEIAESMLERLCQSFDFQRGAVLAVRDDRLVLVASRETQGTMAPTATIDRLIDRAWDGHEALLVSRLGEGSDPCLAALMPHGQNLLITPMFADGQPFGVVVVESANPEQTVIQRRVISMVMQFAAHAALAMRNAWLLEQVQTLADTDALTGVANRRSFEKAITRDIARSIRTGESLTLVMIDLDYFKQLNDMFGHQAGDDVLRRVGAILRKACRESDVPARYGGEEFAILLPGCTKDEAFQASERLRYLIASIEAPTPISSSAGVATYGVHATTAEDLVAAADEALYHSKRMGRDRSTVSPRRVLRAVPDLDSTTVEAV